MERQVNCADRAAVSAFDEFTADFEMAEQSTPTRRGSLQFTLGTLLIVILFVSVACGAAKYIVAWTGSGRSPAASALYIGLMLIPGLLCIALGIIRGRARFWLTYAIALDLVIAGLVWLLVVKAS